MPSILIVDDERSIRNTLQDILQYEGYEIEQASDGQEALDKLKARTFDAVLCDIKMPKLDGLELLNKAKELEIEAQFIMISGHLNIETAVEATRKGAFDFIEKPPDLNRVLITLRNALDKSKLVNETKLLKKKVPKIKEIVGESESIRRIKETIAKVAPTEARVLVMGDNGTGKELVARWIHELSPRASAPFIEVNCAAIPSELIESELFGHEKGAFTGAHKQRIGKFEQAHNGTLFLDEIGDMSLAAQAKVLRALQENKIMRVGGDKFIPINVRVIAATNKDLRREIENHNFREDLYHRLNVIVIHMPALQERIADIPILTKHLLAEICQENNIPPKNIAEDALEELMRMKWTGNVRELRNVVERLIIFCDKKITRADVLQYAAPYSPEKILTLQFDQFSGLQALRDYAEREFIMHKLNKNAWNISKTAEELGIQRTHLYNKIEKYGLKRADS